MAHSTTSSAARPESPDVNLPHEPSIAPQLTGPTVGARVLHVAAAFIIVMVGLHYISSVVAPAFLGLTIVIAVRPLTRWLGRHGVPVWGQIILQLVTIYALLAVLGGSIVYSVTQVIKEIPRYQGKFVDLWHSFDGWLASRDINLPEVTDQISPQQITDMASAAATAIAAQMSSITSMVIILALTIFFVTIDSAMTTGRWAQLSAASTPLAEAMRGFILQTRRYWVVTTIFGLIVAVLDVGILMLLGVPLATTWGVFAFVTNYIPYIGFVLGLTPPALLGLLTDGPSTAITVVIAYSLVNFVIQSIVQPKITGDTVGLNATVTFLSLFFWSVVIGGLGTILAIPLTLFFRALLIESDARSRWMDLFLRMGDRPQSSSQSDPTERAAHAAVDSGAATTPVKDSSS